MVRIRRICALEHPSGYREAKAQIKGDVLTASWLSVRGNRVDVEYRRDGHAHWQMDSNQRSCPDSGNDGQRCRFAHRACLAQAAVTNQLSMIRGNTCALTPSLRCAACETQRFVLVRRLLLPRLSRPGDADRARPLPGRLAQSPRRLQPLARRLFRPVTVCRAQGPSDSMQSLIHTPHAVSSAPGAIRLPGDSQEMERPRKRVP